MAKKKINITLILIVLGLWGAVIYRFLTPYFSNNETIYEKQIQNNNFVFYQTDKDTFKLEKIDRDPFLNKPFQKTVLFPKKQMSNYSNRTPVAPKTKSKLNWPELSYYGYIQSKNQELVLLKMDSKLYRLKLNTPINGLTIKKIYKDSVAVLYNSEMRIVRLKKQINP